MSIIPSLVIQQSYCIPAEFQVLQSPAHEVENKIIHVPVELELGFRIPDAIQYIKLHIVFPFIDSNYCTVNSSFKRIIAIKWN